MKASSLALAVGAIGAGAGIGIALRLSQKGPSPPSCSTDSDCSSGYTCVNGNCVKQTTPPPSCSTDSDCSSGYTCVNGNCVKHPPSGCTSSLDCECGQTCVSGNCVSGPVGQPCSGIGQSTCPCGYSCVNGFCVTCSGSCTTPADCSCMGPDFTGCSNNECYIPTVSSVNISPSTALITAIVYKSQQCCEYVVGASVTTCAFCSQNCGLDMPTAGATASFTVNVKDQYGAPYVGAVVSVAAQPLTGMAGSWNAVAKDTGTVATVTDANGNAVFIVRPNYVPPTIAGNVNVPDCTSTATLPIIGTAYCNGGSSYPPRALEQTGVPVGQVTISVGGVIEPGFVIVEMLPYGVCRYLGEVNPSPLGGCQGMCP